MLLPLSSYSSHLSFTNKLANSGGMGRKDGQEGRIGVADRREIQNGRTGGAGRRGTG